MGRNFDFYKLSAKWTTIVGNPTGGHAFCPVHKTGIVEVNKTVDGATRKYLAYDSDGGGSEIRLYYTDDLEGLWTPYSGNPILGPSASHYRWPTVAYIDGTFHMFLTDTTDGYIERWTSTDGINFTFQEIVISGGKANNPFIWFNPNDNKWHLYFHDISGALHCISVRIATNIEDLDTAETIAVLCADLGVVIAAPTVMHRNNIYWLLTETNPDNWDVRADYSFSPTSGFIQCDNSPILTNYEACPVLLLNPDATKCYLFSNREGPYWYQDTREAHLIPVLARKVSKALRFDGVDDYVEVPHDPSLNITDKFTIELWIKTLSLTQSAKYLLNKQSNRYALIYEYEDDKIEFFAQGFSGSDPRTGSQIRLADLGWHHIVYVHDNDVPFWRGYKDGREVFSLATSFVLATSENPLLIGAATSTTDLTNAILDEVRIYNRALSAQEIEEHYNGLFRDESGLVLHLPFSECEGTVVKDRSGYGNDGSISGAEWVVKRNSRLLAATRTLAVTR